MVDCLHHFGGQVDSIVFVVTVETETDPCHPLNFVDLLQKRDQFPDDAVDSRSTFTETHDIRAHGLRVEVLG